MHGRPFPVARRTRGVTWDRVRATPPPGLPGTPGLLSTMREVPRPGPTPTGPWGGGRDSKVVWVRVTIHPAWPGCPPAHSPPPVQGAHLTVPTFPTALPSQPQRSYKLGHPFSSHSSAQSWQAAAAEPSGKSMRSGVTAPIPTPALSCSVTPGRWLPLSEPKLQR